LCCKTSTQKGIMPLLTNNDTLNKWKIKAIKRNKIIAQQNKRILELEQSPEQEVKKGLEMVKGKDLSSKLAMNFF
jgi:hypothetical protein